MFVVHVRWDAVARSVEVNYSGIEHEVCWHDAVAAESRRQGFELWGHLLHWNLGSNTMSLFAWERTWWVVRV